MSREVPNPTTHPGLYGWPFLLGLTVVGGLIAELAALGLRESGLRETLTPYLVISLPATIAGALYPYLVIRLVYRRTLREFGVRWVDPQRPWLPFLIGASALTLAAWTVLWGLIVWGLAWVVANQPDTVPMTLAELHAKNPLHRLMHREFDPRVLAHVLHMCVVVGFAEELFGRGLLQNAAGQRYTRPLGIGRFTIQSGTLIAALLFAFWHVQWLAGSLTAVAGTLLTSMTIVLLPSLLLCVAYERTRSMLCVIVLHNVIDGGKLVTWYAWSRIFSGD